MELEKLINMYYSDLNETDLLIWNYIQVNIKQCFDYSAEEMANACNVSRATILRFAKKLSLNSYADLKLYMNMYQQGVERENSIDLDCVCHNYHRLIDDFKTRDLTSICKRLDEAHRIFVYGTGNAQKSEIHELKRIFLSAGKCIYELFDVGEVMMIADTFTPNDLILFISLSGETKSALEIAKKVRPTGIHTISLTRLKNNSLARLSEENLYVGTTFVQVMNNQDYEVTALFYILLEILFIKYIEYKRGYNDEASRVSE